MILRLITLILSIIDQFLRGKEKAESATIARAETIKEVNNAINANVAKADAAVSNPEPAAVERMRARFDRSRRE